MANHAVRGQSLELQHAKCVLPLLSHLPGPERGSLKEQVRVRSRDRPFSRKTVSISKGSKNRHAEGVACPHGSWGARKSRESPEDGKLAFRAEGHPSYPPEGKRQRVKEMGTTVRW